MNNECLVNRRLSESLWRTAYTGQADSVTLRQLLLAYDETKAAAAAADDDDDDEEDDKYANYACRVTSHNNYGHSAPSDILVFNHSDVFTSAKHTTISG